MSHFDAEYQAVARSAGGCTVYLAQNRESYLRVLGSPQAVDSSVDSLLGNLQAKFFCQNSGDTNTWASNLLGQRWIIATSTNAGHSDSDRNWLRPQQQAGHNAGISRSEQLRNYVEPARFNTLKRGGPQNNFQVEAIVYNGGYQFASANGEMMPCRLITLTRNNRAFTL